MGRVAAELLHLAELELELVTAGRGDELSDVHDRRDAAIAQLPDELAAPAQATLRLALGIQREAAVALAAALADHGREVAAAARGRTAARGYTPAGLDRRRVLDRTA
ncbi:hypothetical protein [Capillimicrobium parvum]|uniref:hypothetical protein n=1 Tax=Capillimicrobium parvum TaxID=2884022 RepID=UPI00216AC155|nr:hypothetical protein [Capillimicrobium parvum]